MPLQPRQTAVVRFIYSRGEADPEQALPLDVERRYDISLTIEREVVSSHRFSAPFGDERWREAVQRMRECATERTAEPTGPETPENAARKQNYRKAQNVQDAGHRLYTAIADLSPRLREFLQAKGPRRLVIESQRPEIHALPWEAITDDALDSPAIGDLSIVRSVDAFDPSPKTSPYLLRVFAHAGPHAPDVVKSLKDISVTNEAGRDVGIDFVPDDKPLADLVHIVAHGNHYEGTIHLSAGIILKPEQLAKQYQQRLMILLWSCFSSRQPSAGPSVAQALQQAKTPFVLSFAAPLHFDSATAIAKQFYADVFGPSGHQDPERAITARRAQLFEGQFEFCDWASMTLWLQRPIDLSRLPLGRDRIPESKWEESSPALEDLLREFFDRAALGDVHVVQGRRIPEKLPKTLVRSWGGRVVHLHGPDALRAPEVLAFLDLKEDPERKPHRADIFLRLLDHLATHRSALLVWSEIGSSETLLVETLDSLPPNVAIVLFSPYHVAEQWPGNVIRTLRPEAEEEPLPEGPARLLHLMNRERFKDALELADGLKSDDAEIWSNLYVASVKVHGRQNDYAEAEQYIREVGRIDPVEAMLLEGNLLTRREQHLAARAKYQEAAEAAQTAQNWRELARVREELAYVADAIGDRGLADQMYRNVLTLLDDTPSDKRNSLWTSAIARTLRDYADLLARDGDREALPLLRRAAAIHASEGRLTQVAYCYTTKAELLCRLGEYDDADASAQQAAIVFDKARNQEGWLDAVRLVAQAAAARSRHDQALSILRLAALRPLKRGAFGKVLLQMADVSWNAGRIEDAAIHARRARGALPETYRYERSDARRIEEVARTLVSTTPRVAAFAGRALDAVANQSKTVANLRDRLRLFLFDERIEVLVCSAARGADLLALDVAGDMGIRRRVVLPSSVDTFQETSVDKTGTSLAQLYRRVVENATARGDLVVMEAGGQREADANARILEEALTLANGQRPLALIVSDGQTHDENDPIAQFKRTATAGFDLTEIDVSR